MLPWHALCEATACQTATLTRGCRFCSRSARRGRPGCAMCPTKRPASDVAVPERPSGIWRRTAARSRTRRRSGASARSPFPLRRGRRRRACRRLGRRQRLPARHCRGRVHQQGFPDMDGNSALRPRAGRACRASLADRGAPKRRGRSGVGRPQARQHRGGVPQMLHPPRDRRELRARRAPESRTAASQARRQPSPSPTRSPSPADPAPCIPGMVFARRRFEHAFGRHGPCVQAPRSSNH